MKWKLTWIYCRYFYAPVAQLVAQRTLNPWVEGSSPSWGTTNKLLNTDHWSKRKAG